MEGRKAFEKAIDALIVVALVLAAAEDAATAGGAGWALREGLGLACAAADALFSLLFALSLAEAASEGRARGYLVSGLGWVDGLTSLPLLVFVSGPFAFAAAEGFLSETSAFGLSLATSGLLGPLRALRSLRLLRFLRLFSRVKGNDSLTVRRHVSRAASLGMISVIAAFIAMELLAMAGAFPLGSDPRARSYLSLFATIAAIAVAAVITFAYGPFFARGVGAPVVACLRWAIGDDNRVRSMPPPGRSEEEPFILAELLDELAKSESGEGSEGEDPFASDASPTTRRELEGLLSRASIYAAADSLSLAGEPRRV